MSEFPVVCNLCLGDREHVKMVRQQAGEECKLCTRPFTVFRWNILQELKQLKKTILCTTCSQSRNCCQSCMMDVTYGIPLQLRDAALKMAGIPNEFAATSSTLNREVKAIMADKLESNQKNAHLDIEKQREKAKQVLEILAAKLSDRPLEPKSTKLKPNEVGNREVTKIVGKLPFSGTLEIPEDSSVKSFFIFGFSPDMPQYVITSFCEKFGSLSVVKVVHRARCAFVTFLKRTSAEEFALHVVNKKLSRNDSTAGLIILENNPVRIAWGNPRPLGTTNDQHNKIGLVVTKVMQQLADKDSGEKTKRKTPVQKLYKAANEDVEL